MNRPEHLPVPNTPEGIRRINQEQERYDNGPEAYEAQAQYEHEMSAIEAEQEAQAREKYEAEMQAMAEAEAQYEAETGYQE